MPGPVVALVSDLVFATKISSTGQTLGVPVRVVRDADDVAVEAGLVLVDFETKGAMEAIARCRAMQPPPRIVAVGSHVRHDLIDAARAAGSDEVLPRSAFVSRLPTLLAEGR